MKAFCDCNEYEIASEYEERKENGQWLKSIEFKLPIIEKRV